MVNEFQEILNLKWGPIKYEKISFGGSLKMTNHDFPYSISEDEFMFLKNLIIENNLKNGFECATGFGVSSVAIGLGMKETNGKLVTMDAYVEEHVNHPHSYRNSIPNSYKDMDGYKSASYLIEHFRLKDTVFSEVGWSPTDIKKSISKHITEKLDFVFLDSGHFPEQLIKEIDTIFDLLSNNFIIAFHDTYPNLFNYDVVNYIENKLGAKIENGVQYPRGENLTILKKQK
jgi:predicted O-methyltransferase YrrM